MGRLESLETRLNDIFVKQAPPLPASSKKALVQYLPWINLILGLLALYTVYALWHWAHLVSSNLINYANSLSSAYGAPVLDTNRLSFGVWLGLVVLAAEALLYIAAFSATRERQKSGWNLMFYALLINVVYGVIMLFTNYGGIGMLISTLIGSGVGLYLLFQIRSSYGSHPAHKKST